MTLAEKTQEILRLTKEVFDEVKGLKDKRLAGIIRNFGEEFVIRAEMLVESLKDAE